MTFSRLSTQPHGSVSALLEGHIVVNRAIVDGKNEWLLNIEGNKVTKREASNLYEPFPVLANTTIQKTALDIKAQLWIALKAGDQHSLVIWNLMTGLPNAVIPWQTANIDLTIVSNIVIAGETKISTLSYGVETQPRTK